MATGFEYALPEIRNGGRWRRMAWKPGKWIELREPRDPFGLSYIAIVYDRGQFAPWTPTRCDLLERDWERQDGT